MMLVGERNASVFSDKGGVWASLGCYQKEKKS